MRDIYKIDANKLSNYKTKFEVEKNNFFVIKN